MAKKEKKKNEKKTKSRSNTMLMKSKKSYDDNMHNSIDSDYISPIRSQHFPMCYQQIGTKAYELFRYKTGPIVVATLAVEVSLALLRRGSEGATEDALTMALDMRSVKDIVVDNYQAYMAGKEDNCSSCECHSVNLLLLDESFNLESEFARSAANGFLAKCLTLPLFKDPFESVSVANQLVQVITQDTVTEALTEEDLVNNPGPLVLVNALYFKGRWKYPFKEDNSKKAKFTSITSGTGSQNRTVEMMFCKGHFGYLSMPQIKTKMLVLPFADDEMVLLLALPRTAQDIDALEQRLTSIRLTEVLSHASHPEVTVWLPKFTLEARNEVHHELPNLGLTLLKNPNEVQLPFMCRKQGLYLGAFVQKVIFDVTSENCDNPGYPRAPEIMCAVSQKTFKADHSFIFFVMNQYTGWVLCAGRYE